ncbi:cobalamin-dependent protein, partial [Thermodesulfobacteriota bacterium]
MPGILGKSALLVVPPTGLYNREERNQAPVKGLLVPALRPPIDLAQIAAVLERAGLACDIRDMPAEGTGWRDLRRAIDSARPDALFVSNTIFTLSADMRACSIAKAIDPGIVTITKGVQVSVADREVMEEHGALDIILRGEYEETTAALADGSGPEGVEGITWRRGTRIERTPDRPFI